MILDKRNKLIKLQSRYDNIFNSFICARNLTSLNLYNYADPIQLHDSSISEWNSIIAFAILLKVRKMYMRCGELQYQRYMITERNLVAFHPIYAHQKTHLQLPALAIIKALIISLYFIHIYRDWWVFL